VKQVLSREEVAALLQGLAGDEPEAKTGKSGPVRGETGRGKPKLKAGPPVVSAEI
jgi:hypothetical protein